MNRLTLDLIVNLVSLAFLAVAGIALNVIIGRYYGPSDLGVFNIVFALFIFASQFGSAGLQYSMLRFASLHKDDGEADDIFRDALRIVLATSTATVAVGALATPLLGFVFGIDGLTTAWLLALPGLWCFSVNKVLLAFFNGVGAMRTFAVYQSARYVLMVVALLLAVAMEVSGAYLAVILSISECTLLLLLGMSVALYRQRHLAVGQGRGKWRREHLRFGLLAMPSGVIAELNTRVDVLLLGAILGSYQTGIYSLAILLAEGFGQVVFVVRNVVNPLLSPIVERRDQPALTRLVRLIGGATLGLMVLGGGSLLAMFPFLDAIMLGGQFERAFWPLVILVLGLIATGPMMVFVMILSQGGRPGIYSMLMVSILVSNVAFNLIGVFIWGIEGAAIGTVLSYFVGVATLAILTKKTFGLNLSPL